MGGGFIYEKSLSHVIEDIWWVCLPIGLRPFELDSLMYEHDSLKFKVTCVLDSITSFYFVPFPINKQSNSQLDIAIQYGQNNILGSEIGGNFIYAKSLKQEYKVIIANKSCFLSIVSTSDANEIICGLKLHCLGYSSDFLGFKMDLSWREIIKII